MASELIITHPMLLPVMVPLLSGLGVSQRVTERPEALYRRAAVRTMAAIEQTDDELQADVERVLARYANQYDRLVDLVSGMLGRRDQWLEFLLGAHLGGFDRAALEEALEVLVGGELAHARALLPEELVAELPRFLRYSLKHDPEDAAAVEALLASCDPAGRLALPAPHKRIDTVFVENAALAHVLALEELL